MNINNNEVSNELISYYLKKKRKQSHLTGSELAKILNISQQQVSRYENGISQITVERLNQYLKVFGISWQCFIFEITRD